MKLNKQKEEEICERDRPVPKRGEDNEENRRIREEALKALLKMIKEEKIRKKLKK